MFRAPAARVASLTAFALAALAGTEAAAQTAPAARGRALAAELGCGACHAGAPDPRPALERAPRMDPGAGTLTGEFVFTWLADPVPRRPELGATRMPDFRLDEAERVALALFLGRGESGALAEARRRHPAADAERGARIFSALGCGGCHEGVEGAEPIRAPDLSREGARVRPDWLASFLADPRPIRGPAHPAAPGARMPDFRLDEAEREALVAWLLAQGESFAELPAAPLSQVRAVRTERLLEERASCLGCHRVKGRGGRIGPSLEAMARRLSPDFVLEMILAPGRAAPGSPMPHQPLPRREAEALARHLLEVGGGEATAPGGPSLADPDHPAWTALAGDADDGSAALYARHCAACHGPGGGGDGWNAPDLPVPPTDHTDASLLEHRVDDALYDGIHAGAWVLDGSARMPAFGTLLTSGEIRGLVAHIRRLCDCLPPAWSRDGVGGGRAR